MGEAEIMAEIQRRQAQDKQRKHLGEMRSMEQAVRQEEREKVRSTGKMPYFHKRGAIRQKVLEKRKEGRKGKGQVRDKQEERREKKVSGREKRRLPTRRITAEER